MNGISCEDVRDLLPLQRHEELAAAVDAHLAGCAACRAEAELVALLRSGLDPVPDGLEARVLGAVRSRPVPRPVFTAGRFAMAATLAAAVIGGVAILSPQSEPPTSHAVASAGEIMDMAWDTEGDPLLHSGSTLQQLSVEELELLLAELD